MNLVKKAIALTLTMSLGLSLLAGCANSDEPQETNNGVTEAKNTVTETKDAVIELSLITHEGKAAAEDSKVYKELQEKLNVKLNVIETTSDNRGEKVNIMLATGDIPDLFFTSVNPTSEEMQKWIKQGLILPYDNYMTNYPNLEEQLVKFQDATKLTNDQYYMLHIQRQIGDYATVNDHNFWIRTDYLNNLGMEMPTTFDEFNELIYAMTYNDPDGNGINDTFGVSLDSPWWLYSFYNMFGASESRFEEIDGVWSAEILSDDMKEAVTYLNKIYNDGVLDPEFMISKSGRVYENFVSGKAGLMFKNGGVHYNVVYDQFSDAYPVEEPKDKFSWLPIVPGPTGEARLDGGPNYWGATCIGNTGDEARVEKSLEVLDFLASQEGQDLFFYGVEGEHYQTEGNEKVSLIPDNKTVFEADEHGHFGHMAVWLDGLFPSSVANQVECKESYQASMDAAFADPLEYVYLDIDPTVKTQVKDYGREGLIRLITESDDVNADWQAFVDGWYAAGGDELTQVVNDAAK